MKCIQILAINLALVLLISCVPTQSKITPDPNSSLSSTPTLQASSTQLSTTYPSTQTLAIAKPDEQVYIDPDELYSVAFPAEWEKSDSSSYVGSDGFFETGYLPELGFAPDKLTVCEWLANIKTKNLYTVAWQGTYRCQLFSRPEISPATTWEIIENPLADFSHRFFYIRADSAHFKRIASTFTWLRPIDEEKKPDFSTATLRSEDITFWNNTSAIPANFSLKEYALPPEHQQKNSSQELFIDFVPPELLPVWPKGGSWKPPTVESVNQTIAKYDYEFQPTEDIDNIYDLYQNDKLVLQNIYPLPEIYLFQTKDGNKLIFFVQTHIDPKKFNTEGNEISYLVHDKKISMWEKALPNAMISEFRPILVENKPLFLRLGKGITLQVLNAEQELISSFATYYAASVPIKRFESWKNHWILGVSNFIVQDGEILNEKYNFEEVHDWILIKDKPLYFFRKGPRSGFSYDGQFFSTYYHEILHGRCCMLGLDNPVTYNDTLRFFGKRDGVWYYVILKIK